MFIPRQPVIENQFCKYAAQTDVTTGVGASLCEAGAVLYLDDSAADQDAIVKRYSTRDAGGYDNAPFGLAMQRVKTGYHAVMPTGAVMPGDLGSSDVIAQASYNSNGEINGTGRAPLAVAHLGIWDTTHYVCKHSDDTVDDGNHMKPGQSLYAACNNGSRVTNHDTTATDDSLDYERINSDVVAKVVVGASAGQCSANIANTTLYPIKIKLLV